MAKILVTGNLGFVGSNLTLRLLKEGHEVVGVDDMRSGFQEFYPHGFGDSKKFYQILGDYSSNSSRGCLQFIKHRHLDAVVHLAATPRVSYSIAHPAETHNNNVTKLVTLLDGCKGNIGRFIFASSSSVYGGATVLPTPETHHLSPKSPYALQKVIGESYLEQYSMHYGLQSLALRFFNVFGPNATGFSTSYSTAIAGWLTAIKEHRPLRSDGDGSQTRDICYVDNTVDAIVAALQFDGRFEHNEAVNVASGERISNNDILAYLMQRYPDCTRLDVSTRAGDVPHTHADIGKAERLLGYTPKVTQLEGIKKTCDWFDENWSFIQRLGHRKV